MTNNATMQPSDSPPPDEVADQFDEPSEGASFPIVGIGASAGGLEAFTQLLKALPADTGMAFVLVQHLAPSHPSALSEILARATKMPVTEVTGEPMVEPNHVYVIPPDRSMIVVRGALQLLPREGRGAHHPVDQFFRSLAEEQRHRAIGVVLSGTATDGTIGLEEIKAEGGITFAQDATAQHEGMPHSAVASGCVDFVLPPVEIAREIVRIGQHPYAVPEAQALDSDDRPNLVQVVQLLLHATGVDFTGYKFNTIYRRVTRRMVFQKMDGLAEYLQYLQQTPAELDALYQDILISVTSFFRDKESFEVLKTKVFPRLLKDRSPHDPVRLWTLGCSTGQEAYSLAMAFTEAAEAAGSQVPIQLFASDLNAAGIEKARAGVYPKDIAQDVSPERLRRFFSEVDGQYRITKSIRDACVFSRHNVLADPPFSRIDLISCRNLLIYLEPVLQQRIMPTLHYALKPAGCLWLGGSETIGTYRNLFDTDDAKHKIYAKKPGSFPMHGHFPLQHGGAPRTPFVPVAARPRESADLPREADRILLTKFAPPGVLVTADLDILQYRGDTGPFLAPAPGKASLNLLKMLREGLLVAVRAAVLRADKEQTAVREDGLRVKSESGFREVAVEVIPVKGHGGVKNGGFLVLFEEAGSANRVVSAPRTPEQPASDTDNARLEQELAATREYLQSVIEQQESANEELQSANEEVQSANEELQSTNEELETSKEEIQSSNEELATVNDELNNRNAELHRVNNDLVNLIGSVQVAIVMLGPDLRVRRFTPMAEKSLNLIPTDVGRPMADIKLNLADLPDLEPLLKEVLETAGVKEREVRDRHGRWYSLRMRPYRTLENKIDGVVVMLVDVDETKRASEKVRESERRFREMIDALPAAIYTTDAEGRLTHFNPAAVVAAGRTPELGKDEWCITWKLFHPDGTPLPHEKCPMAVTLQKNRDMRGEQVIAERPDGTQLWGEVYPTLLRDDDGQVVGGINMIVDITERKRTEALLSCQKQAFEMVARGTPLLEVLDLLVRTTESQSPHQALAAIHLLDESGAHFERTIAPSLPPGYSQAVDGMAVSSASGCCCATVAGRRRVAVPDIAGSKEYPAFASFALPLGLRAACSTPIFALSGKVLGSFVTYYHEVREPEPHEELLAEIVVQTAAVVIERNEREERLLESEDRFHNLANTIPQLAWIADAGSQGQVHWFNQVWFDYTGTTLDEMKGSGWKAVHHPDHVDRVAQKFEHHVREGLDWEDTFPLRGKDGRYRWFLSRMKVIRDQFGKVVQIVGTNTDVTVQRQMADELRQNAADMSEADHRKNEFLAMLAHELRNPLAPIRNAVQILQLTEGAGESVRSASAMMERQVGQMVRLVDDLLDVSRISRGKIELRQGRVELASVIHHAVEAARTLYKSVSHELTVTLPPTPIYLNADPTRLTQVIGNLLNNAFKFTNEGGGISLIVEREGDEAVIKVRDTGVGIAADQLPRIFEMFMQIDTSLERCISGLGIGLTLVKKLVEMHDGTVKVFSAGVGQGSEFVVRLPIMAESPLPLPLEPTDDDPPTATPRRILVVDDNHDSATSLAMLLKCIGNETHTAFDGLEAVEAAATFKPDVILLDIGLPKLNGYEACRKIREQPWRKDIVMLALTGWGQEEDRQKSRDAGFNGHLVKPVDLAALTKMLAELLPTPD